MCSMNIFKPIPTRIIPPMASTLNLMRLPKVIPSTQPTTVNKKLTMAIMTDAEYIKLPSGTHISPVARASMLVATANVMSIEIEP